MGFDIAVARLFKDVAGEHETRTPFYTVKKP